MFNSNMNNRYNENNLSSCLLPTLPLSCDKKLINEPVVEDRDRWRILENVLEEAEAEAMADIDTEADRERDLETDLDRDRDLLPGAEARDVSTEGLKRISRVV